MKTRSKVALFFLAILAVFCLGTVNSRADNRKVVDISEWQGKITLAQAKNLKSEVQGVILRVQYGSTYADKTFVHNAKMLRKAGVPFGVYSYSMYTDATDAKNEARVFFNRAEAYKPVFYANDAEQYTTTSGSYRAAVKAWGTEMQSLTSKPVALYSGSYFYRTYIGSLSKYDKFWEANYGSSRWYDSDLWQYSDSYYSTSLGHGVDGNRVMKGQWFKSNTSKYTVGGRSVGETVRVAKGATFYGSKSKIADALTKTNLKIKQVKVANTGKSKQVVLVYHGKTVVGWVRAQDVTAYYHSPKVTRLKVIGKHGINTYHGYKRATVVKKGTVLAVSHFAKNSHGIWKAGHEGHTTTFTARKGLVKWAK